MTFCHAHVNDNCEMRDEDSSKSRFFSKSYELTRHCIRIKRKPANRYVISVLAPDEACVQHFTNANRSLYKKPAASAENLVTRNIALLFLKVLERLHKLALAFSQRNFKKTFAYS